MKIFKISAINNEGVQESFQNLVVDIIDSMDDETLKNRLSSFKLNLKDKNNSNDGTQCRFKDSKSYKSCC